MKNQKEVKDKLELIQAPKKLFQEAIESLHFAIDSGDTKRAIVLCNQIRASLESNYAMEVMLKWVLE